MNQVPTGWALATPESRPQPQPLPFLEKGIPVSKKLPLAPGLASCGSVLSSFYFGSLSCILQIVFAISGFVF